MEGWVEISTTQPNVGEGAFGPSGRKVRKGENKKARDSRMKRVIIINVHISRCFFNS